MYRDFYSYEKKMANMFPLMSLGEINRAIILDGPQLRTTKHLMEVNRYTNVLIYEKNKATYLTQKSLAPKLASVIHGDIRTCTAPCDWLYLDLLASECNLDDYPIDLCQNLTITISVRSRQGRTLETRIREFINDLSPEFHIVYYYIYSRNARGGYMCQVTFSRRKPEFVVAITPKVCRKVDKKYIFSAKELNKAGRNLAFGEFPSFLVNVNVDS
jgi:hypothetical protein